MTKEESIMLNINGNFKSKREGNMVKTIDEIIARMKVIRDIVKLDSSKDKDYFREYYELETNLRILDLNNPELNIGIHGKPYFAGLSD